MQFHFQEMATNLSSQDQEEEEEEDYIDMELIKSSPTNKNREFEFQMSLTKQATIFPADELFYKGKLLPLEITKIPFQEHHYYYSMPSTNTLNTPLDSCNISPSESCTTFEITKIPFQEDHNYYSMPPTKTLNTPSHSCNISPSESCRVSCELNPDEYFFEWSQNFPNNYNNHHPTKKSWSKKLKLIKQYSVLGQKLRSLFKKSACSDESSSAREKNCNSGHKFEEISNKYLQISKKKPTIASIMKSIDKDGILDNTNDNNNVHRRSFSSAIKRHSPVKCLSSSSSSSSSSFSINSNNGFHELRRSSSATEIEGSIEAAIAHCKKSQQVFVA